MNKWSRNSIYGAGLASLLYLGCGNSVQNKDIKVQEDIDLGLADRNLDDFYQPTDSSLEDRINPIDSRELDYPSEDSSSEIQGESDILPDSLEYDNNPDYNLNDLSRDDYSIDLGSDYVNGDAGLDVYVNEDVLIEYDADLCVDNHAPIVTEAYIVNPNPNNEYEESTDIPVYIDAMDLDMDILTCIVSNGPANNYNSCNNIINVRFFATGEKEIWTWAEDTCKNQSNAYIIPVNIISKE